MARPSSSAEEEDAFQYINWDQAAEVDKVGAWEGEDRETFKVEDHLHPVELPSQLSDICLLTHWSQEEHARPHGPDVPDGRENVGLVEVNCDAGTSLILQQLSLQHQEAVEGYFIGLEGQRNAPTGKGGTGIEEVEPLYQLESTDAETGELLEQQTTVGERESASGTEWANTTSATEDWSLVGEHNDAAGPSSHQNASSDGPPPDSQLGRHGHFVCDHPGCGISRDCLSKLNHHRRKHIPMEDRPIVCLLCPGGRKRFLHQKDLNKHLRSLRHAVRQFECPDCQKRFTRDDLVRRHRKTCRRARPP